ncbi:MAG: FG-GAP repeat protein, partial [Planctomycetaceae bacterium]|nr:FG-GAP repeat protein [Planctomycetaceae bacterium]
MKSSLWSWQMSLSGWLRLVRNTLSRQCRSTRPGHVTRRKTHRGSHRASICLVDLLEDRALLAADFGDAPDTSAGTGAGDYQTLSANGGPSHTIDSSSTTLFLGQVVDGDDGTLQNTAATADDRNGSADDEDGIIDPMSLTATIGSQPFITLQVTNTTVSNATLYGWIDYNGDGVFDNATERAQATVATGTTDGRVSLTFPAIPLHSVNSTYARFRLSTDSAAANATGAASDGEVEDYAFQILFPSGTHLVVSDQVKLSDGLLGMPSGSLDASDGFGSDVASVGDIDNDGVNDIVVGAWHDGSGFRGGFRVLLLNADGTVKSHVPISHGVNGFNAPSLDLNDAAGNAIAGIGDINNDGVPDVALGARDDENTDGQEGAIYVLLMNSNGTVGTTVKVSDGLGGFAAGSLDMSDRFGTSITGLGDLDGDGVPDIAVGAEEDAATGNREGAVYILFMNNDGTVRDQVKISEGLGGFSGSLLNYAYFGSAVAALGDLDKDGVTDLAVGGYYGGPFGDPGQAWILFMNSDGTVKSNVELRNGINGIPANTIATTDHFGWSATGLGDVDGDGNPDVAFGADGIADGGANEGGFYLLLLNANGTVKSVQRVTDGGAGFAPSGLDAGDLLGSGIAAMGDMNGDGRLDIAIGARGDENGDSSEGAVYFVSLQTPKDYGDAPDYGAGTDYGDYKTLASDNGPAHLISTDIYLGATVDGESGTLQNDYATADDQDGMIPDDEDGVLDPADLIGIMGTAPSITLLVTNNTGSTATLSGWIDYNSDGVFDNATERAQTTVSDGTTAQRVTLTFPTIPGSAVYSMWARFRLSTDSAADNSTGLASDGEVEDYVFTVLTSAVTPIQISQQQFVSDGLKGIAADTLEAGDSFGSAIAFVGDIDDSGRPDLAVGAPEDENSDAAEGAVYLLTMFASNATTVVKITDGTSGLAADTLDAGDHFGAAVTGIGDLNKDGVPDIVVGAPEDENSDAGEGAIYLLTLNASSNVTSQLKISDGLGGFTGTLAAGAGFGSSLTWLGDLNGDGNPDLAVGAPGDGNGDAGEGAVYILFLNADGTVGSHIRITDGTSGLASNALDAGDAFGSAVASIGDLDGDGITDLVVGASHDGNNESGEGAVFVLFLNADGTVDTSVKISDNLSGLANGTLETGDAFGAAVAAAGDLDGDGIRDIFVGAPDDEDTDAAEGAVYVLLMNANGTVKTQRKITDNTAGIATDTLTAGDHFGAAIAGQGNFDFLGAPDLIVGAPGGGNGDAGEGAAYQLSVWEGVDYGDAPDASVGTSNGNYQTTSADNGPSHLIYNGIYLGKGVDPDDGTKQNTAAAADDTTPRLHDDEDGVLNPLDLQATIGSVPQITLLVTNFYYLTYQLTGWIDYNGDGVFDNNTERAQVDVPAGTEDGRFLLTFPQVPAGFTGTTYARFRLGNLPGAHEPVGYGGYGEVEDYQFTITQPAATPAIAGDHNRISDALSGLTANTLDAGDHFGSAVANIGDLNGDGVVDIAVGAAADDNGDAGEGAIYILLMNSNGTVSSQVRISDGQGGLPGGTLEAGDAFGSSIAAIGDIDSDGVVDLIVGAAGDENSDAAEGAAYILKMNSNGSVKSIVKISDGLGGLDTGTLDAGDSFGTAVAGIGDLNADGVPDVVVGAAADEAADAGEGAAWVLFLKTDGTVGSFVKLTDGTSGLSADSLNAGDAFGSSVAAIGDLDSDGVGDLAIGAVGDDNGDAGEGALFILLMNADGTVKSQVRITDGVSGLTPNTLAAGAAFGASVAMVSDLNADGVPDIAVGATGDGNGDAGEGAVYVLLMNANGTVSSSSKLSDNLGGLSADILDAGDQFGSSLTALGDLNGDGVADILVGAAMDENGDSAEGAAYVVNLAPPVDYGDAPDGSAGTGAGNYQTVATDSGPSHQVNAKIFLGSRIDGNDGTLQNARANADDMDGSFIDEDAVLSPLDLTGTEGTSPQITLQVTNVTGSIAILSGWIDYNADGVFDNTTERVQASVSDGAWLQRVTLTFPEIPSGTHGITYARFRLSTDAAAANPTGAASDGEVEDYRFTIVSGVGHPATATSSTQISSNLSGGPALVEQSLFGQAVASIGDLNNDGVPDLAVGSLVDADQNAFGAVHILFMNANGTVATTVENSNGRHGNPTFSTADGFGNSIAAVGDIDGDGIVDLAVGAPNDDTGGTNRGAVYLLFMNSDGTTRAWQKIAHGVGGGPSLDNSDTFGSSIAAIGDLNGDGRVDIAVGTPGDDDGNLSAGALYILGLNQDGTVHSTTKISNSGGNSPILQNSDQFGISVAAVGDVDNDGVIDIAAGAPNTFINGSREGVIYLLRMNSDGTVKSSQKIADGVGGGPAIATNDNFGRSLATAGDLNGDGIPDLIVGATDTATGTTARGSFHILTLNADGTAATVRKIGHQTAGGPTLLDSA